MFETKKQDPSEVPTVNERKKVDGTTYDVCKPREGSAKLKRTGTLFMRSKGNGGVLWITDDDGTKHELVVLVRTKPAKKG